MAQIRALLLIHEVDHELFEDAHRILQLRHPYGLDGKLAKLRMVDLV